MLLVAWRRGATAAYDGARNVAVVLERQHDLGGSVPARGNVLGHEGAAVLVAALGEAACEAKVANLEGAVGVHEQVARLEVAVQHLGRVDVLETAEDLVNKILEVAVGELLVRADDLVQVRLHELLDHVDLVEVVALAELEDLVHARDVFVARKVAQKLDLAQRALGQDLSVKDLADPLHGDILAGLDVGARAHRAVRAAPQVALELVAFRQRERGLGGHHLGV